MNKETIRQAFLEAANQLGVEDPNDVNELRLAVHRASKELKRSEQALYLATTKPCDHCKGEGKVYGHDPSGDGHGGLNGGSWGYSVCHKCLGEKRVKLEGKLKPLRLS